MAVQHLFQQPVHLDAVGQTQHVPNAVDRDVLTRQCCGLVEKRQGVAYRSFRRSGNDIQCASFDLDDFVLANPGKVIHE